MVSAVLYLAFHLTRLLLAFSLSYLINLALGATKEAQEIRAFVEIPRRKPRQGTTRTLSALVIGILRLSFPRFAHQAYIEILTILQILFALKRPDRLLRLAPMKDESFLADRPLIISLSLLAPSPFLNAIAKPSKPSPHSPAPQNFNPHCPKNNLCLPLLFLFPFPPPIKTNG